MPLQLDDLPTLPPDIKVAVSSKQSALDMLHSSNGLEEVAGRLQERRDSMRGPDMQDRLIRFLSNSGRPAQPQQQPGALTIQRSASVTILSQTAARWVGQPVWSGAVMRRGGWDARLCDQNVIKWAVATHAGCSGHACTSPLLCQAAAVWCCCHGSFQPGGGGGGGLCSNSDMPRQCPAHLWSARVMPQPAPWGR